MTHDYLYILKELRQKLHDPRGSKAAVMVGSGFSRNATPRFGGGRQFPLWKDLTGRLVDGLYTDPADRRRVLEAAGATSSALRLSEEFEAAFGRSALIEIVRQETSDDDFEPSRLYEKLVDLPWADIFTTNYDRLIERAALASAGRSLRRFSYEVVTQSVDIPLARRPRIVKLHGTLPDLANLVLTEEDFRCYGTRQAAFVNAVRASMSENAFCLLGFSGDDPNFLAWSGWIRDTLREATPTVYLLCTSPPVPFKRKLLEQRNVVPIPLGSIFGNDNVGESIERLLDFLGKDPALSTVDWNRPPDSVQLKSNEDDRVREPFDASKLGWIETALIWRKNRLEYQGWEVLHRRSLSWLWSSTEFALHDYTASKISKLRLVERLLVTRELLWRLSMCLTPIWDYLVDETIDPLLRELESDKSEIFGTDSFHFGHEEIKVSGEELGEAYRFVVCHLVRHAREIGDRSRFQSLSSSLKETIGVTRDDLCFVEYQRLLFELGSLEADSARKRLRDWDVDGLPAIWTVRRCGLLMEIGETKKARSQLLELIDSLVSTKVDPKIDYQRHSVEAFALYQMELANWWLKNSRDFSEPGMSGIDDLNDSLITETTSTYGDAESPKEARHSQKEGEQSNRKKPEPEIVDLKLTRRLRELNRIGCDPKELLYQFDDLFKHYSIDATNCQASESDHFDIGRTTYHHRSTDGSQLRDAYRVIRFVEESGLPISIHGVSQLNTSAMPPFLAAASVIAKASCREAAGPVLRSRDDKLAKAWLDRRSLSIMSEEQVAELLQQAVNCFERSRSRYSKSRGRRDHDNQWWERQLRFACIVFGRLVPRLSDDQLKSIAKDVLSLSGDPEVWKMIGVAGEVEDLVRRVAKCLPDSVLLELAPDLLAMPVAFDGDANFVGMQTGNWVDPLSQLDSSDYRKSDADLSDQVGPIIEQIATVSGEHRKNLVLRIVSLWHRGLLNKKTQKAFRDALFLQLDDDGFPDDTACYDSLILGLPKRQEIDETKLYQHAYVGSDRPVDVGFWANLARSVDRERDFGVQRRSVKWSAKDLEVLVSRTSEWATKIRVDTESEENQHPMARAFLGSEVRDRQQAIREWLHFLGDAVLLSVHFKGKLRKATIAAIQNAEESQICTVRLVPFMRAREAIGVDVARTRIRNALVNDDEFISWQACSAIVQWGRLATSGTLKWQPGLESLLGTSVLLQYDNRLVLVLTASRELLEVYPTLDSPTFFDDLIEGLKILARKTSYKFDSMCSIEERIRIRIAAVKLAQQLLKMNIVNAILNEWLESARADCFAEVRRAAVN